MTPLSAAARRVLDHLDYLERTWPDLVELGVERGSRRRLPSSRRQRSTTALAVVEAEARAEQAERRRPGWVPGLGKHPVPIDVEMLDVLTLVVSTAEDVAGTVTQTAGVERPVCVGSAWEDPRPWLRAARAWLTAADEADERTVPWAAMVLGPVVRRVASVVGEIVDGQVLDALCPWCGGRSQKRPTGGARTLVVRAPGQPTTGARPEMTSLAEVVDDGPLIVCSGTNCSPPPSAVGMRVGGQPAWPWREWDWLARQLRPCDVLDTPSAQVGATG